jgi:uncharacterized protein (TIGR02598 family)
MKIPAHPARRRSGFTLAEVMISLMIVSTVMIGMVGAIPHAVKSVRESNGLTIMGRIAQELTSDIQMSEYDDIERLFRDKTFLFDNEGLKFVAENDSSHSFEAKVEFPEEPVSVSPKFDYRPDHIRKIKITVEYTPGGTKSKDVNVRRRNTKEHVFLVANQNQLSTTQQN